MGKILFIGKFGKNIENIIKPKSYVYILSKRKYNNIVINC